MNETTRYLGVKLFENEILGGAFLLLSPGLLILPLVYYRSFTLRKTQLVNDYQQYYTDFKLLAPYLRPQNKDDVRTIFGLFSIVLICIGVCRVVYVCSPLLLRHILSRLSANDAFPWTEVIGYVFLRYFLGTVMYYIQWAVTRRLENQVLDRFTIAIYDKMMSLSAEYHDSEDSGTVWQTVRSSGDIVSRFVSKICFGMIPDILDLILSVSAFAAVSGAYLGLLMALVIFAYAMFLYHTSEFNQGAEEWDEATQARDKIGYDTIPNWWTVMVFGRINYEKARHAKAVHHQRAVDMRWCENQWLSYNGKHFLTSVGLLVLCLLVSHDIWSDDTRESGDLVMFLHLWAGVLTPTQDLLEWNEKFKEFSISAKRLLTILRHEVTIKEKETARNLELKNGSIKIEGMSFSYPEKDQIVLQDISVDIEGGKTVAVVGRSGSGKSTLLKLLMRGYDTTSGRILIDGQDVKHVRQTSIVQHISIVPQNIGVFNTSIIDNLRYAKLDASLEECEEACRAVGLHEKIMTLNKKYEETIGEKGCKLSGGELQRLAIARVLLRDTEIILFDEVTSNLDAETEHGIQQYLRKWCEGKTVIIVAHRLVTVAHADLIIAIKDGQIVESGSHENLLAKKGYFYDLWDKQRLA